MSNLICPSCQSKSIVKNGIQPSNQKQKYLCKDCHRQFLLNPQKQKISDATKQLIDRLLLERLSQAGISRAVGVSKRWLQSYVNAKYAQVKKKLTVRSKATAELTIECDELWSYVQNKLQQQWVWLAINKATREIVGLHIGGRETADARALWQSLPKSYQRRAFSFTDFYQPYTAVLPKIRHQPVAKGTGLTNHIERFNNTLRQRISRLVRKSLSFSKKIDNHHAAIWYFVHHYNASLNINKA